MRLNDRAALRALLGTLACFAAVTSACSSGDSQAPPGGRPPSRVATATVQAGPLVVRHQLSGRAQASQHATLAAGADGAMRRVLVQVGDRVSAGQLLFEVDPGILRADLAAAQATALTADEEQAQAARDAARVAAAGTEVVSGGEIEQAQSRAEQLSRRQAELRARVRQTRSRLSQQIVRAPFDGQIVQRLADPGDWVSAGSAVLELVDLDHVEVHAAADPSLLESVREGMPAAIRFGEARVAATVAGVVRAVDGSTGTAPLRVVAETHPAWLLPGRFVDVELELSVDEGGVVVSRDAIVRGVRGARVATVVNGAAVLVPVEVLAASGESVLVRPAVPGQRLEVGQAIVVRGNERLRPDEPVSVAEQDAAGEPAGAAPDSESHDPEPGSEAP